MSDWNGIPRDVYPRIRHYRLIEVRLVDGRGLSRVVCVPPGATEYCVTLPRHTRTVFGPEGAAECDVTTPIPREVVFSSRPDVRMFDRQHRPVWFPETVLRTHPATWPAYRELDAPVAVTDEDRRLHRELDQYVQPDHFDPYEE